MKFLLPAIMLTGCFIAGRAHAQPTCPPGYELRNVKCNGTIRQECVPTSLECNACWVVEWTKCNSSERAGSANARSYEGAMAIGAERKMSYGARGCKETGTDYTKYVVFLEKADYCKGSPSGPSQTQSGPGPTGNGNNQSGSTADVNELAKKSEEEKYIKQQVDALKTRFLTETLTRARSKLYSLKTAHPERARQLEDKYWPLFNSIEQKFMKEANKGADASPALLNQYIRETEGVVEKMSLEDTISSEERQQQQQYQQNANALIKKSQDPNQSPIVNQTNLSLAQVNATMGGNKAQQEQIEQLQAQQKQSRNESMAANAVGLAQSLYTLFEKKRPSVELNSTYQDVDYVIEDESLNEFSWPDALQLLREVFKKSDTLKTFKKSRWEYVTDSVFIEGNVLKIWNRTTFYHKGKISTETYRVTALDLTKARVRVKYHLIDGRVFEEFSRYFIDYAGGEKIRFMGVQSAGWASPNHADRYAAVEKMMQTNPLFMDRYGIERWWDSYRLSVDREFEKYAPSAFFILIKSFTKQVGR